MTREELGGIMGPFMARMRSMITFGKVARSSATGSGQTVQARALAGEDTDDVQHVEPFGFTSNPNEGAEVLIVALNEEEEIAIVCGDRRYRLKGLAAGEVALYNDTDGVSVELKKGPPRILIHAPKVEIKTKAAVLAAIDGVLTGKALDPYTGQSHFALGNASGKVFAEK